MITLRKRFPKSSEIITLFLICVFPTHVWSLIAYLRKIPSYILRMGIEEIVGVLAYTQTFILLETFLILLGVLIFAFLLPKQFVLSRFVPQATILVLVTTLWSVPVHYQERIVSAASLNVTGYLTLIFIWMLSYIGALLGLSSLLRRSPRFDAGIQLFVERVVVLSAIYISVDIVSLLIVLYRNLIRILT